MAHNRTRVDTEEIRAVAAELDRLAQRMSLLRSRLAPVATVPASGSDEVSTTVAEAVSTAGRAFERSVDLGADRLRELSQSLSDSSRAYVDADDLPGLVGTGTESA